MYSIHNYCGYCILDAHFVLHVHTWIQILVYLFILQEHNFHPVEIKYGLLQLAEGLSFLHNDARLFHGNLTPENVIINHKGEWKLGGFHFCCYAQYTSSAQVNMYYHITLVHAHACTYTYTHARTTHAHAYTHTHTHTHTHLVILKLPIRLFNLLTEVCIAHIIQPSGILNSPSCKHRI